MIPSIVRVPDSAWEYAGTVGPMPLQSPRIEQYREYVRDLFPLSCQIVNRKTKTVKFRFRQGIRCEWLLMAREEDDAGRADGKRARRKALAARRSKTTRREDSRQVAYRTDGNLRFLTAWTLRRYSCAAARFARRRRTATSVAMPAAASAAISSAHSRMPQWRFCGAPASAASSGL